MNGEGESPVRLRWNGGGDASPYNRGAMSPKIKICKENNCMSEQTTEGFCRLHYLKNWKVIKSEKKKKAIKSLNNYVENIIRTNPENYKSKVQNSLFGDPEGESQTYFQKDDIDSVMEDLGYKEDLDRLIDGIKVDKDF